MFIYIPYGTDAPVYHRPYITAVMIIINAVIFAVFPLEQTKPYMLAMGDGLHPVQWLTTNFLHSDIFHLIFNMLFLWVFGLVVEGKLGTFRMLILYLGLAVLFGASVQMLTLQFEPGFRSGASGVIFGLAAMSFIWAPESKIHGIFLYWWFRMGGIKDIETEIIMLVGFFAVLQIIWSLLFGSGLVGELGHIVGAILGLIIAVTMLKANFVDCEYQDIFSVHSGMKDLAEIERKKLDGIVPKKERKEEREKQQNLLIKGVESALEDKTPLAAFVIFQRIEKEYAGWTLPQNMHLTLIQQLLSGRHLEEAMTTMRLYLDRHQEQSAFVRLMLAQVFLTQNKPRSAMEVLDKISLQGTGAEQQSAIQKVRAKADALFRKNMGEGIYEVEELG